MKQPAPVYIRTRPLIVTLLTLCVLSIAVLSQPSEIKSQEVALRRPKTTAAPSTAATPPTSAAPAAPPVGVATPPTSAAPEAPPVGDVTPSRRLSIIEAGVNGSFAVLVDGVEWFGPGEPTSVRHRGRRYSAHDRSLELLADGWAAGSDSMGRFRRRWWRWAAADLGFNTAVRVYADALAFEQTYVGAAVSTAAGRDGLVSCFPSLALPPAGTSPRRGFLQYQGDMAGQLYRTGVWEEGARGVGSGVAGTGPLVVFGGEQQGVGAARVTSVVLSPLSSFMSAAQRFDGRRLTYGLLGTVEAVPAGHAVGTLLVLSAGVRRAMLRWGDVLLARYGKARHGAWLRDATLRRLGYCTQNGAYYYYNPMRVGGRQVSFEETVLAVAAEANRTRVPYRYWLADSWWYTKGGVGAPLPGIVNWSATAAALPHGFERVRAATGWDVQAQSRFWSAENVYARENGGAHEFALDRRGGMALPLSAEFWEDIFSRARRWGMVTYEQDWMDAQHDRFPPLLRSATLGRQWLTQMGDAAGKQGVSLQYCMAYCRHVMQSLESLAVTQVRASGDYRAGNDLWAPLGVTSLFAYALGLAPSKDTFWTTARQPGSRWGDRTAESAPALQAAVATLSRAPACRGAVQLPCARRVTAT